MSAKVIMTDADMRRAITRIAHEIVENTRGTHDLVLVGMHTRGVPLAHRIAAAIKSFEGVLVPVGALDIGLYRDDLPKLGARPRLQRSDIPTDITDKHVVLVDDVLYTGRSVRAALDALTDFGRPRRILLAALVDRGHRETDGMDRVLLASIPGGPGGDAPERPPWGLSEARGDPADL
jgi:pyrimidine operon attenuation protein/uracil phosphoribosyltransferase